MLKVQEYLRSGKTLADLKEEFGIKSVTHEDGRVILNYDQIDSPKLHPIVIECRALVLEENNWDIVARGFNRFFNLEEALDYNANFDWDNFTVTEKADGSLILVYFYNGEWKVNTRGSFAEENVHDAGKTWADLFWNALGTNKVFLPDYTYIFEFCSPYNKIVREYQEPTAFLLSVYSYDLDVELPPYKLGEPEFNMIPQFNLRSKQDIINFIATKEETDPTYEGVVLRDKNNLRIKVKSKTYVALHHLKGNDNLFLAKNLLPFIMAGETSEVLAYFPEAEEKIDEMTHKIDEAFHTLKMVMEHSNGIDDQKEFALLITKEYNTPFTGILFTLRKQHGNFLTVEQLEEAWMQSSDSILKHLFK